MPQNNNDIVNSQEFKEFVKNNLLEVSNLESLQVVLYKLFLDSLDTIEVFKGYENRIQKLEERLMEVGNQIVLEESFIDSS